MSSTTYAHHYYLRHRAKWHKYHLEHPVSLAQGRRASRRYYHRRRVRRERAHLPLVPSANRIASQKWKHTHHARQLKYQRRSKCKHYILSCTTLKSLSDIEALCQHVRVMLCHYYHRKEMQP